MEIPKPARKNTFRNLGLFLLIAFAIGYGIKRYYQHKLYENISRFDYVPNADIDYFYHNEMAVHTYLANCKQLTDIAKTLWLRNRLDVKKEKTGFGETQSLINRYNSLLHYTKALELRLIESKDLKEQGLTNEVIKQIQDKGVTLGAVQNEKDKMVALQFLKGKNVRRGASSPSEIWEMQKLINANGYNIPVDGIFSDITDSALADFQRKNNLQISHICDDVTLMKLSE